MLKEIGVDAYPVLIRAEMSRSAEDLTLPMISHFNHCTSYVPDADGKGTEMWLDGPAQYHSALLPPACDRAARVLVATAAGAALPALPQAAAGVPVVAVDDVGVPRQVGGVDVGIGVHVAPAGGLPDQRAAVGVVGPALDQGTRPIDHAADIIHAIDDVVVGPGAGGRASEH